MNDASSSSDPRAVTRAPRRFVGDGHVAASTDASRSVHRPSDVRRNRWWPAKSATAMCSAIIGGAPGSWHTCEMSVCESAGPAAR